MTFDEWVARTIPLTAPMYEVAKAAWEAATLAEREACAKVCDAGAEVLGNYEDETKAARSCAAAIRTRSNGEVKADAL